MTNEMKMPQLAACLLLTFSTFLYAQPESDGLMRLSFNSPEPYSDLAVGLWANPLPMDYDQDGDIDMVVSCTDVPFNGTFLFENRSKSGDSSPIFEKPVRIGDGMRNVSVSYVNGEPRVLGPGVEYENFRRYGYTRPVGIYNAAEIHDQHPKKRFSDWKYVDYENDGDLDLIVGIDDWSEYGWDNAFNEKGEWTNGNLRGYLYLLLNEDGKYTNMGKLEAGEQPIDVYGNTTPNMADFDGDGDLDIICGEFVDQFTWFENTGSRENPKYAKGRFLKNNEGIIRMDLEMMRPVALDWNSDGSIDLIVGDEDGRVVMLENTGQSEGSMPVFKSPVYIQQRSGHLKFGALVTPFGVDWDDDGDEDLICGNSAGYISFVENLGGGTDPRWGFPQYLEADGQVIRIMAGENGSIQGPCERKWGYTTLSVADWDGDGLKDILVNSIWGKVVWYKNSGKKGAPMLTKMGGVKMDWSGNNPPKPAWNWWNPAKDELATQWRTTPYAIDWNQDGLMDLVMLDHEGYLAFFERFKKKGKLWLKPGQRIFRDANATENDGLLRLNDREAGRSGRRKIAFTDWDQDGDLDLLANSKNIEFYENIGEANGTTTFKNRGYLYSHKLAGHTTSPTVVDWNNDGKPELVIGAEDGHFYYAPGL